jgi:MFS family permease
MSSLPGGAPSVEKSLQLSLADAFLYSLMVGIGETYLPAFALSVGLGEVFAGILASLPLVSGALLQLFTPKILRSRNTHKSWVVLSVTVQALAFLPLIYYSFGETPHFWTLFAILTLYWGAGFSATPAWNYWMGQLVPESMSQKYFATRARLSQIGILIGLVIGGVALHNKITILSFSSVFGGLFFLAFLCRMGSSILLSRKRFLMEWEPPKDRLLGVRASWGVFWKHPRKRKFFLLLFPYMASVYISAPFVTPYFLAQMKMDYGAYMIAIAALMTGKIVALTLMSWQGGRVAAALSPSAAGSAGQVSDAKNPRGGGFWLFSWGVILVSPGPAFWVIATAYPAVLLLQFISGIAWAALEVGLSLIFFKDLTPEEKVPILTIYNVFNAVSIILGTLIGGWMLTMLGENIRGYLILFFIGSVLRVIFSRPLVQSAKAWQNVK